MNDTPRQSPRASVSARRSVTFFLVAEQAQQYPELVRRMTAEGHTVGLHAFRHRDYLKLTEEEKRKDLEQGKTVLHAITGNDPVYWRPPHGFRDFSVTEAAAARNLTVVNWSVIPRDWTGIDSQEIHRRVTDKAEDGRKGLELAESGVYDLVLLDIMLPALNGLEVLRRLRKTSDVPVIVLTARDAVMDKVSGLDMGADDYVTKPFAIEELLARIRLALRRKGSVKTA